MVSCIFFLLSFLCYHQLLRSDVARPAARWLTMAASLFFAVCSLLSKEQGITVLGVCGAYDVLHHWDNIRGLLSRVRSADDDERKSKSMGSYCFNTKALPDMIGRICKLWC